jgi:leucyl/phenylalanyl-tRNA---protein transferase
MFTPAGIEFAYRRGIFPMHDHRTGNLLWFQPDPRTMIPLNGFHISHSLAKTIRQGRFEVRYDTDFVGVMRACGDREEGTWISEEFIEVYGALHRIGKAHSVEVLLDGELVGGTYGVALGGAFMAESMFHRVTDASKVALAALVERLNAHGYALLDVQYLTPHLASLGAVEIPHRMYYDLLRRALRLHCRFDVEDLPQKPL